MQQAQPSTLRIPDCRPRTPKSPPPPPINLDDCKPLLSTTDTNTSTNSGINGNSAFVFTSSRTIRALQLTQEDRAHDLSPPSSPSSPPSPTDSAQRHAKHASLSFSQLSRHSEGAIDARSILGPNMRAAGFVHLTHSLTPINHQGQTATPTPPTTPSSPPFLCTPTDPPPFPPIMFVSPNVVATTPMWEYQRELRWGMESSKPGLSFSATGSNINGDVLTSGPKSNAATTPQSPIDMPHNKLRLNPSSSSTLGSSEYPATTSSLMSAALSSSSVVDASYVVNEKGKGKAKARDAGVDGFPFPPTFIPVHSRPRTSSGTTASALSLPSAVPLSSVPSTSTAVSTTSSRIRRSHQHSHSHTDKDKRKETNKAALVDQDKPRTFATARPRHHHNLSLTELFDASPLAWTTCSESFIPASSDPSRARSRMAVGVECTSSVTSGGRTRAETERTCVSSRENVTLETLHENESASHAGDIAQAHPPSSPVSDQSEDDDRDKDNDKGHVHKERPRPAKDREQAHKFIIDVDDRSVITGKAHLSMRERGLSTSHVGVVHDFGFAQDVGSQEREVEQIERDRLTALAYAHRERDREHARHAAEREKHLLKKRSKARGKSTLSASDDSDTLVDANFSTPVR